MPAYDIHPEGLPSSPTRRQVIFGTAAVALLASCGDPDSGSRQEPTPTPAALAGAIYAGTNKLDGNSIAVFTRNANGMLAPLAEYLTGGLGGVFDGSNDGLDPLISEDSIVAVDDRFLLAVNPGSNTIASLRINSDSTLTLIGTAPTGGVGPISIAYRNGIVYVANVDTDGAFAGPPDQSGSITGFRFDLNSGQLTPIAGSTRNLGNRPSNVEFSPDGRLLVVSSVNAGSAMLASRSTAELTSFGVLADGNLTSGALGTAASTLPGNAAGRNLPTAIGFEIVERGGRNIVIASEAREFLPDGRPGMLPMFQTGSVSTWELNSDGSFSPRSQDVLTGPSLTSGPTSACWIVVAPNRESFWVASASGATISSYRLNSDGTISLIESRAAAGSPAVAGAPNPLATADGFIDIALSSDGAFLFQLLGVEGTINVYRMGANSSLSLIQEAKALLPETNIQGLVSVTRRA